MKPLLIATQNLGKIAEFEKLLAPVFFCKKPDTRAPEVLENGNTYQENALKKAQGFFEVYQTPVLSDDSGLEIDVLQGAPGLYSARFGSSTFSWPQRFQHLYQQLSAASPSPETWSARFRCILCYYDGLKEPRFFEGVCEGRIETSPKGQEGFGYDPLFYSLDLKKGFGEASEEEKAWVSHRGRAVSAFLAWVQTQSHKLT